MAQKSKYAEPVMTNSAAIRVLYDLAGGRAKTWPALARDLDINVDDIYKRNRPWPSDFGRVRYCDAFEKYASEVHTTPYATLLAVRRSLQDSNAYTDEVKAIVDNVLADTEDAQVRASLERLRDTIIETARPYNEVERALGRVSCGEARATMQPVADFRMGEKPATDCMPRQCGGASAGEDPAPARADGCSAPRGLTPAVLTPAVLTPAVLAAALAGTSAKEALVVETPWYRVLAGAFCPEPACARRRAVPGMPLDAPRFLGAVLAPSALALLVPPVASAVPAASAAPAAPHDLLDAAFVGALPADVRESLVRTLCDDEGLGCRTMLRRCAGLLVAADDGAFFSVAEFLLDHALPNGAGMPDVGALDRLRSFYLRFGDGDPARCLLVLVLLALLGPVDALRVTTCPATHWLFERP